MAGLLGFIPAATVAALLAWKERPAFPTVRAAFDGSQRCGGLLMAEEAVMAGHLALVTRERAVAREIPEVNIPERNIPEGRAGESLKSPPQRAPPKLQVRDSQARPSGIGVPAAPA